MKRLLLVITSVLAPISLLGSCGKETQAPQAAQTRSSAQPAAPAAQPAQAAAAAPTVATTTASPAAAADSPAETPAGKKATEKHTLAMANNSRVAVTVTLNGAWVGQWDANASAPLDSVVQGKNELGVELADEPKSWVTIELNAEGGGQNVNLLRLNFQGKKPGKYTYNFVAR